MADADKTPQRSSVSSSIGLFLRAAFKKIVERKRWWLLPLWILLVLVGVMILLSGGSSVLPVIYIVF